MLYFGTVLGMLQVCFFKVTPMTTKGILPMAGIGSDPHFIAFPHFDFVSHRYDYMQLFCHSAQFQ